MTRPRVRTLEATLVDRVAAADRVFCFLDFDGTLAPLAPTPEEATALPGTAALLTQLAAAPGMQLAVVSGRTIEDLRRRLGIDGIFYVGVYGLEILGPDGLLAGPDVDVATLAMLPAMARQLRDALQTRPGVVIEDKGLAIACHYRLASRADAAAARATVAALANDFRRRGADVTLLQGHEVLDIRPTGATKGTAVRTLLAAAGPRTLAIYLGDSETNEEAFAHLPGNAITVRIGPTSAPTLAHYRLSDPAASQCLLRQVLDARGTSTVDGAG